MQSFWRALKFILLTWFSNRATQSLQALREKIARAYLSFLQALRESVLLAFLLFLGALLTIFSIACFLIGLYIYLPWDIATKAIFLMAVGGVGIVAGGILIFIGAQERRWMEIFRVRQILEYLLEK